MFKFIFYFISIFLFLNLVENTDDVNEYLVETKYGTIRGYPLPIEDKEINVKVFLGIPYAKAPINELRFEKPLPPKRWNGVRNATEMGPACFPFIRKGMWVPEKEHSEDCLHLNILAPDWQPIDGKPFPVLVYVHGGGFQEGTTREIRPEVLARKYVQEGIVFVTFQYRIGQLGFAATGDEKFAGNYGLWDQKLALEFVRENIDKFGGDPKRVTIWGFSAGSASVSALSISHQTKDLFGQVIQMSGSILGEWAASNRPIVETEKMAKELGCGELLADSAKLKKCLKAKSVHELMDAVERMGSKRRDLSELLFTPRLDADFFSNEPMHLIHETPPKRTMIGMTKLECIAFTMFGSDSDDLGALFVPTEKRANFGWKNFEEFVREIVAPEKAFGKEEAKKVQKRILEFYLAEKGEGVEFYLRKYNELLSDLLFLVPILKEARAKTLDGWPIYLYQIDYFNRKYFPENIPVKDSCHAIELPAVFDIRHVPYLIEEYSDEDLAFAQVLVGSIIHFVKNGDPSMASFKWPKLSAERPLQYAQLNSNPKMMSSLAAEKLKFWQQIEKDYSFDIIRGIHKITLQSKDEL